MCHLTFTFCASHCGFHGNELADEAAKKGTTVDLEDNHHCESAMRQATKEPPITRMRLCRINGERGKKVNNMFESLQLSRKDQVYQLTDERSSPGPEILASRDPWSSRYCLPEMRHGVETVEHVMVE